MDNFTESEWSPHTQINVFEERKMALIASPTCTTRTWVISRCRGSHRMCRWGLSGWPIRLRTSAIRLRTNSNDQTSADEQVSQAHQSQTHAEHQRHYGLTDSGRLSWLTPRLASSHPSYHSRSTARTANSYYTTYSLYGHKPTTHTV